MAFAPYPHQSTALEKMHGRRSFALLMGMRTGKTKVAIDDWVAEVRGRTVDDLFVIAPAGVYRVWQAELVKHVPDGFQYEVGVWSSSDGPKKRSELLGFMRRRFTPRVFLMNVEALSSKSVNAAKEIAYEFMTQRRVMLVVDESTTIKNPKSNRTSAVFMLGRIAASRRILSGLPTPRSPLDAYAQFAFLDPSILGYPAATYKEFVSSYYRFFARYAVTKSIKVGARPVKIVTGYRNVEEIHRKIQPHSFRILLRDCSSVPDKLYLQREVELTPEQRKAYSEMKAYMTVQFETGEHVTADQVVTSMLRLHQICCGHVVDDSTGRNFAIPTNRLKAVRDILEEYDGKAIIWCSYEWDLQSVSSFLRQEYGDRSVAQFWGGNARTREEDNRRFQEDPECLYMVAMPGSGGRGRDWSAAGLLIYYSNTDNLEYRDQSEERASGVQVADRVTVIDLIARGTVEEKIVKSLRSKIDLSAIVTGDDYREWIV